MLIDCSVKVTEHQFISEQNITISICIVLSFLFFKEVLLLLEHKNIKNHSQHSAHEAHTMFNITSILVVIASSLTCRPLTVNIQKTCNHRGSQR